MSYLEEKYATNNDDSGDDLVIKSKYAKKGPGSSQKRSVSVNKASPTKAKRQKK